MVTRFTFVRLPESLKLSVVIAKLVSIILPRVVAIEFVLGMVDRVRVISRRAVQLDVVLAKLLPGSTNIINLMIFGGVRFIIVNVF